MRNTRSTKLFRTLSVAFGLAAAALSSQAQDIPAAINYQGRLTDNLGNTLASGYYEIEFRIWDDPTSTSPASLVWGRTFPLHVVNGGLFNILLTDDGGEVTTPGKPQSNDLRQAFGGEDRYLGLTIKVDPSGTTASPSEISPRQQLASAPYAMQAQTANAVRNLGVTSAALANTAVTTDKIATSAVTAAQIDNGAVTTAKIADSAVTTTKVADSAVTTAKIADRAVTSSKLNVNGDIRLNDHTMYLRSGSDTNHGLKHAGSFAGRGYDGPALFGYGSGVLGTTSGGEKAALSWDSSGSVSLFGAQVDLSKHVQAARQGAKFQANCDGFMMYYGRRGVADFQVWVDGGQTALFAENTSANPKIYGAAFYFDGDSNDGRSVMWPIKKGDHFQWSVRELNTGSNYNPINNKLYFLPLGLAQGSAAVTVLEEITN